MKFYLFLLFLLFPALTFASTYSRTQILMGNIPVSISIRTSDKNREASFVAMEKGFEKVKEIEHEVSQYLLSSAVNELQNSTLWHTVPYHLYTLIAYSLELSKNTEGAFDITYASQNKTASYRDILVDPILHRVKLNKPKMSALVLGVAKGYIVDQMSDVLKANGFPIHLVNAGGDLYAAGRWRVKIRNPNHPELVTSITLKVKNKGISTSGLYERGHHIYSPKTKKPFIATGSVTIIAPNATLSDGLDNAAFVLGEKAEEVILKHYPGVKIIRTK